MQSRVDVCVFVFACRLALRAETEICICKPEIVFCVKEGQLNESGAVRRWGGGEEVVSLNDETCGKAGG